MQPIEVRVLNIKALCRCGAARFHAPHPQPYTIRSRFTCAGCGQVTEYGALLDQIGEEAMRQAQASCDLLRRRARRSSGPA